MKKVYLLNFSMGAEGREKVKSWLNNEPLVSIWRYDMPNCFYVVSEASAQELSKSFIDANGKEARHLFAEITDNRQGLLTPESWYLMRHKKRKPTSA